MKCPRCSATLQRSRDEEAAGDCLNCGPIYIPTVSDPGAELEAERPHNPKRQRHRTASVTEEISEARDGCDVAPKCLECPLAECRYVTNECSCGATFAEETRLAGHRSHCERDMNIVQAYRQGTNVDAIAARFNIHRRSVYRAIGRTEQMELTPAELAHGARDTYNATGANPAPAPIEAPMRILSTDALGQQCIQSLRTLSTSHAAAVRRLQEIQEEARKLVKIAELTGTEVPPAFLSLATGKPPKTSAPPSTSSTGRPGQWKCDACGFTGIGQKYSAAHREAHPGLTA